MNPKTIPGFAKMKALLEADDFKSADVKKVGANLYRCRLDIRNRLLFSIYQHGGQRYALILEFIANHAYEKSRFLEHGAAIDESRIATIHQLDEEPESLVYLNEKSKVFNILDKVISFDATQHSVYTLNPPIIIIGSAGSGKTALTLEKMKHAIGDLLYVTHSPYLVKNSRDLYYSMRYDNEDQRVDFFSLQEFLESIHIPAGREVSFHDFRRWFAQTRKSLSLNDPHKLMEEFKGVITGTMSSAGWLSRGEYLQLGIKQSIFQPDEREEVYKLFESYHRFIDRESLYDSNIICHQYAERVQPRYDLIIIDEVQDITSVQLALVLKSLYQDGEFIICGDSNQIVHPNFFSWSKIKSFFYREQTNAHAQPRELITVLNTNYRNSPEVTEVANRLLKLKNARFGSIDKESNYLVKSSGHNSGNICFLQDREQVKLELEQKTRHSTRFAIIVIRDELKEQARREFTTPLIFSVQEAKGLEYENIILYNFVASDIKRFATIAEGVHEDELHVEELTFSRVKDKSDKSLEIYKFHINAFYVAITRAVKNLYIIEREPEHPILKLMGLHDAQPSLQMAEQNSCFDEWREEARKLELQGKSDQADEIRSRILQQRSISWRPLVGDELGRLDEQALVKGNKRAKLALFEYALVHHDLKRINRLQCCGFAPAKSIDKGLELLNRKHFAIYTFKNSSAIMRKVDQYGVDFRDQFNHTPLMLAARLGNVDLVEQLCEIGADTELCNNSGFNALQIALEQACVNKRFAKRALPDLYQLLAPAEITLQVDGRLLKLLRHTMEFTMLNIMVAMFYRAMPQAWIYRNNAFNAASLTEILQRLPDSVIPHYRKKQSYISGMLSKNELDGTSPYNRRVFQRIKRGQYIINPAISVRNKGEWVNIYDLLNLDSLFYDLPAGECRSSAERLDHQQRVEIRVDELVEILQDRTGVMRGSGPQ
ncbi:MAG: AAA family ATPase [Mariprofundales bacterium]|nr:AAA family ATPase [Mariprofundales bacterium]